MCPPTRQDDANVPEYANVLLTNQHALIIIYI